MVPWQASSVTEQRLEFVVLASRQETAMAELCRQFGISRATGYTWLGRYRSGGVAEMVEQSRRPRHSPRRTGPEIEQAIVELRQRWPDWGAPKLARVLAGDHPDWGRVCVRTVHRVLDRHNLIQDKDRHRPAVKRFERSEPNELWQMDFKGPQGFNPASPVGPLSILDDHSRFLLALEHLGSTRTAGVRATLERTFTDAGVPQALLVDHGTPWWNGMSPWGLSELAVWIMRQGVRLLFSGLRHPQTQGKIERMHGALQRAIRRRKQDPTQQAWLDEFRYEYNHVRPHAGIDMATPATRWRPSLKPFQLDPAQWLYQPSQIAMRLAGQGQLRWSGRRFEVSNALRHQVVGLEVIGERALVFFCSTPIRELDLRTGRSYPISVQIRDIQC